MAIQILKASQHTASLDHDLRAGVMPNCFKLVFWNGGMQPMQATLSKA